MTLLHTGVALSDRDTGKYFRQALKSIWGQVDGHIYSINDPTQYQLDGDP